MSSEQKNLKDKVCRLAEVSARRLISLAKLLFLDNILKEGIDLGLYKRLIRYIYPYKRQFIIAMVCMVLYGLFTSSPVYLAKPAIDNVFIKGDTKLLAIIPFILIIMFLLKGLTNYFQKVIMKDVAQRGIRDLRYQLFTHIERLPIQYFKDHRQGDLISRVSNDVMIMEQGISTVISDIIKESFTIVGLIIVLILLHWKLAFIAILVLPLSAYPIIRLARRMRKTSKTSQEKLGEINTVCQETFGGISIVKAFNMEHFEAEKFRRANNKYYKYIVRTVRAEALSTPLMEFIGAILAAIILWLGGKWVIAGAITTGTFWAFIGALFMMYSPFKKVGMVNYAIQRALAAAARIFEVMDTEPTIVDAPDAVDIEPIKRSIEFRDVYFKYEKDTEWILAGFNLEIEKGETLAIVGLSGVGKTTLANLIPRFYDVTKGAILIDGIDIRRATTRSLREQIGIVSQHTILFNDTIRNNIAYGKRDVSEEKVIDAARKAYAHDFITEFPRGYDTIIGEGGLKLSGGQRQRISIARAIFKDPPILILDEATSSLDTESELIVQQAIINLVKNRTTIVIAHRLSTISNADRIIVIDGGKIAEQGTHEELMRQGRLYKKLHDMQFKVAEVKI